MARIDPARGLQTRGSSGRRLLWSLAISLPLAAGLYAREFYRLSTAEAAEITEVSSQGVLRWESRADAGDFSVERASKMEAGDWAPFVRGRFSNQVSSVKVFDPAPPAGMVFIPGGQFTQGDTFGDIGNLAIPVHQTVVRPFLIGKHEVTNEEVKAAYQWALEQGLVIVADGSVRPVGGGDIVFLPLKPSFPEVLFSDGAFSVKPGRGNYPSSYMTWYGAVAYCNFRSLMENREVCYDLTNWSCDFTKKGYRLPTEAEWEIAARGGYESMRFPWSDSNEITHSRANYRSSTNNVYDVSPTRGFHPDYANTRPRSSPVGAFAPNGYGLHDMCGNVWEWVWDWSAKYPSSIQSDPVGPGTGTFKVFRGGSWYTTAERVTCAARYRSSPPSDSIEDVGFRVIIPAW